MRALPTREAWLLGLVNELRPYFGRHKAAIPKRVRVTCGWTGKGARTKRIGECWAPSTAADGTPHIYISPVVDDMQQVAATVTHELVHAAVAPVDGHGGEFARVAKRLGLVGPMRSSSAGPELAAVLADMTSKLGAYPHARVTPGGGPTKTQTTRMVKLECPSCGYMVRTTQKWIAVGLPTCPSGDDELLAPVS